MLKKFVNFQIPNSGVQTPWLYIRILEIDTNVVSRVFTVGFFGEETDEHPIKTQQYSFDDLVTNPYELLLSLEEFSGFERV